jgi:hypothetical protein
MCDSPYPVSPNVNSPKAFPVSDKASKEVVDVPQVFIELVSGGSTLALCLRRRLLRLRLAELLEVLLWWRVPPSTPCPAPA